jgi:glycosyltransferase involved in cell wall biosynthesis
MIVKDEEQNLPRALAGVADIAGELVVVDTGSNDGTVAVAAAHGARIVDFPWTDDFSAARNAGLAVATGRWVMVLDADEELDATDRAGVLPLLESTEADALICPVVSLLGGAGSLDFERSFLLRFWRNHPGHRYTGLMHEDISPSIYAVSPSARIENAGIRFTHYGYLAAAEAARDKKARNLALIEAEVARNPRSHFYRFNLGVEYQRHNRFDEALAQYRLARPAAGGTPWEPKLTKNLVYTLLSLGRWDEGEKEIAQGLVRFPDFTDLLYFRGVAEVERKEFARATGTFSRCAAMGPAPVPPYAGAEEGLGAWKAYYALGQAHQAAGGLHEAVTAYEQAQAMRPEWLAPLESTATVLLKAGVDPARVRAYVEERLPRETPERALTIADMLYQGGAVEAALAAVPAEAEGGRAAVLRGYCAIKLGRWEEAAAGLAAVAPGDVHRPAALAGLAFCHWCAGREAEMQAVLTELGDDMDGRRRGAALFIDAARETLTRGLARFPDSGPLKTLLERLGRELP